MSIWERICKHKRPVIEPRESALFASSIKVNLLCNIMKPYPSTISIWIYHILRWVYMFFSTGLHNYVEWHLCIWSSIFCCLSWEGMPWSWLLRNNLPLCSHRHSYHSIIIQNCRSWYVYTAMAVGGICLFEQSRLKEHVYYIIQMI